MPDPFISAHRVFDLCYDLGGRFQPISIRDQTLRAFFLIERLFAEKLLTQDIRVLVVGAGVTGVTAGIQAARRGATVTIVEQSPAPFLLQRAADSRWVDPTQYDWPLDHWKQVSYPWSWGSPSVLDLPLRTKPGPASEIALRWGIQLHVACEANKPRLTVEYSTAFTRLEELESARENGSIVAVTEKRNGRDREIVRRTFDTVLFCQGFGSEITSLSAFVGIPFWSAREKEELRQEWMEGPALIVGGGDGALQDFLLLTTGLASARQLFGKLFAAGEDQVMERRIHCAEDQAQRAFVWSGSDSDDHNANSFVEGVMADLARKVLESPEVDKALAELLPADAPPITIAHSCDHFGRVYALNRFLALTVIHFLRSRGCEPRKIRVRAVAIDSADEAHRCDRDNPDACYAFQHKVGFGHSVCSSEQGCAPGPKFYQRIIVRRGVNTPPGIQVALKSGELHSTSFPYQRQLLPFFPL